MKSKKVLDLSKPMDARKYIAEITVKGKKPEYVDLASGKRVWLNRMTDAEAVTVAHCFHDMVSEKELN